MGGMKGHGGYTGMANIGAPGEYGEEGVGNSEAPYREVTSPGMFPNDNMGPGRSQGETPGAGSLYSATIVERPNLSNNRNQGPSRAPSRSGGSPMPIVGMNQRKVNRL